MFVWRKKIQLRLVIMHYNAIHDEVRITATIMIIMRYYLGGLPTSVQHVMAEDVSEKY